jgi:hypothetical protein
MYVITFNRDMTPDHWEMVGGFATKEEAGAYAKADYRRTRRLWVVHPVTPVTIPAEV